MRTLLQTLVLIISTSLLGSAQAASTPQPATKPKPPVRKPATSVPAATTEPTAIIHTTAGDLHCTLYPKVAPIGVENFIGLASGTKDWTSPVSHAKKHGVALYDGTIFHRVISNFMIQGGGFEAGKALNQEEKKGTKAPIKNEASNGLSNKRGTIAMARTDVPDSATSQFYINHKDNGDSLDKKTERKGVGYCVFGNVLEGMDVVDRIAAVRTKAQDVPVETVTIKSIQRADKEKEEKK